MMDELVENLSHDQSVVELHPGSATPPALQTKSTHAVARKLNNQAREARPITILSSGDFAAIWKPPKFVVDGVTQNGFLYAITAKAGTGKTAVALRLAAHVALGQPIGPHEVEKGRVLFLAGENPDDIRTRLLVMSEELGVKPAELDIDYIQAAFKLKDNLRALISAAKKRRPYSLVIVDTSTVYFSGDDENDNLQAQEHAALFRNILSLPGNPCVVVICHPPKSGGKVPRGGSAFLNEIDGNINLEKQRDGKLELIRHEKFRGPQFDPIKFELAVVSSDHLVDAKGRPVTSVVAKPSRSLSFNRLSPLETHLLETIDSDPKQPLRDRAKVLKLSQSGGHNKVSRMLKAQEVKGNVEHSKQYGWRLTKQGEQLLEKKTA